MPKNGNDGNDKKRTLFYILCPFYHDYCIHDYCILVLTIFSRSVVDLSLPSRPPTEMTSKQYLKRGYNENHKLC